MKLTAGSSCAPLTAAIVCAQGDSRGQSENQAANPAGNCILQTCSINRATNGETLASDMQHEPLDHCRGANVIISAPQTTPFNFAFPHSIKRTLRWNSIKRQCQHTPSEVDRDCILSNLLTISEMSSHSRSPITMLHVLTFFLFSCSLAATELIVRNKFIFQGSL